MPGMCDTPAFLNLHLLLWDSYITDWMSGRLVSVEGRTSAADTHLAFARSQNCRNGTLGSQKRKTYVTKDKNHKIQKRITGYDVNASYPVLFLPGKP